MSVTWQELIRKLCNVFFVWDPVINRIVHATKGVYAVKAFLVYVDCKVYSLHYVSCWGKTPEFELRVAKFESMDPKKSPARKIKIDESLANHPYPEDGRIGMVQDHGMLKITVGDDCYSMKI